MTVKVVVIDRRKEDRDVIIKALNNDTAFDIIATGNSGKDAISLSKMHNPNLLILSSAIIDMDLISVVKRIMQQSPLPILIVDGGERKIEKKSKITQYGLVDWLEGTRIRNILSIPESGLITRSHILSKLNVSKFSKQLTHIHENHPHSTSRTMESITERRKRVQKLLDTKVPMKKGVVLHQVRKSSTDKDEIYKGTGRLNRIIVIGTSTGGPKLLNEFVPKLPPNLPPVILVQHMPEGFTEKFSERLNRTAKTQVKEAEHGEIITSGNVYVAPGGYHLEIVLNENNMPSIMLTDRPPVNFVKPSVDVTLMSALNIYGSGVISVILTGMGSDGKIGSIEVKKMGGTVLALHESDTDLYGMNRSVIESGVVDEILKKNQLTSGIVRALEGQLKGFNI
ncbi:MAG: Chemotaxis response regulator protein-glutamate methylesterase [Candidatus Heimdallarchaeota archaeon LC_2]|nr:MAG: Chemotaxis response regulator protein-glutamate methylesterase [Candidatus Heimdallarchaeota archaeon LC_2]